MSTRLQQSTIHRTPTMSFAGLLIGLILSVAKGPFGDLFRAMGLTIVLAVRRSGRLSSEYPILPYARRALLMQPRRPFPPAENPWRYRRAEALADMEGAGAGDEESMPPEFSMAKVGSECRCCTSAIPVPIWSIYRSLLLWRVSWVE